VSSGRITSIETAAHAGLETSLKEEKEAQIPNEVDEIYEAEVKGGKGVVSARVYSQVIKSIGGYPRGKFTLPSREACLKSPNQLPLAYLR
jgi:hypothetical protein